MKISCAPLGRNSRGSIPACSHSRQVNTGTQAASPTTCPAAGFASLHVGPTWVVVARGGICAHWSCFHDAASSPLDMITALLHITFIYGTFSQGCSWRKQSEPGRESKLQSFCQQARSLIKIPLPHDVSGVRLDAAILVGLGSNKAPIPPTMRSSLYGCYA